MPHIAQERSLIASSRRVLHSSLDGKLLLGQYCTVGVNKGKRKYGAGCPGLHGLCMVLCRGLASATTAAAFPSGDPTDATKPQGNAASRMVAPRVTAHGRDLPMPSTIATDTDPSCLANCADLK